MTNLAASLFYHLYIFYAVYLEYDFKYVLHRRICLMAALARVLSENTAGPSNSELLIVPNATKTFKKHLVAEKYPSFLFCCTSYSIQH